VLAKAKLPIIISIDSYNMLVNQVTRPFSSLVLWPRVRARVSTMKLTPTPPRGGPQVYKARMDAMKANPALKLPSDWVTPPPERPHKAKLLVKLKSGATRDQREFVINGLKNFIKHNRVLVSDTAELVGATVLATQLLMLFFYVGTSNLHHTHTHTPHTTYTHVCVCCWLTACARCGL
jgi:hypothetical protein